MYTLQGGQGCQIFCKIYKAPFKIYTDFFGAICIFPSKCLRLLEQTNLLTLVFFLPNQSYINHKDMKICIYFVYNLGTQYDLEKTPFSQIFVFCNKKILRPVIKIFIHGSQICFLFFYEQCTVCFESFLFSLKMKQGNRCYSVSYILIQYSLSHSRSFLFFFKVPRLHIFPILYLFQTTLQLMCLK